MVGVPIGASKPNDADLVQMLPSKRRYDLHWLFWEPVTAVPVPPMSAVGHDVRDGPPAKKTRVPASSSSGFPSRLPGVHEDIDMIGPIATRTRSHSRLFSDVGDSQHSAFGAASPSDPCPSLIPSAMPTPAPRGPRSTPLRARALPLPRRPPVLR